MPKVPKLKEGDYKKFKNFIKDDIIYFLPLFPFLFAIFRPEILYFLVFFALLYYGIVIESNHLSFFKGACSDPKNLEIMINMEFGEGIYSFMFISIIYLIYHVVQLYLKIHIIAIILIVLIFFFINYLTAYFAVYYSEYFLSHFDLKRKIELSVYISPVEFFIISSLAYFLVFLNKSWLDLTLYLSIQSFEYLNIVKISFICVIALIVVIINIQINSWRINKRFERIINLKTKDFKKEKNKIIKTMRDISDSALKKRDDKEQWRRNEILKTRLNYIESEINKISNEYTSKPNYLSKIPIIVAVIYALFEIFMKILEFLSSL